ncbi:MAG: ABC transporter ATP-binding protein/permease [Bdellovibrionales bacterium]|nr:ABC transporter ATP-binding protein/permease [Bdellovibrionales bacterium]
MIAKVTETELFRRLMLVGKPFWVSEKRTRALFLVVQIFALLGLVTAVNVWVAGVAGKFATALQGKDEATYHYFLLLHVGVILIATPIIVTYHYIKARLAMEWREWLSAHLIKKWFSNRAYYKLSLDSEIDNPDERIAQDVDSFCSLSVGLFMSVVDSVITVVTFMGLLYYISPTLTAVAIFYCLAGCLLTQLIGRRLPQLNFDHLRKEADLRYSMAEVRRDVESIAFYRGEERASAHIVKTLRKAIDNVEEIMVLNRNLSLFTSSYNWFVALIPAAVIAPLYFNGTVEFGEIARGGMAFSHVFAGLTLFIGQYNALSAYKANIDRIGSFIEKLEASGAPPTESAVRIRTVWGDSLSFEDVTILTPDSSRVLVQDLTMTFLPGGSYIIMGPSGSGKSAILRTIAGIWSTGSGTITRPPMEEVMFLPQQPYVPVSTLREALCYPRANYCATTPTLLRMLQLVNLADIPMRVGGLDVETHWRDVLSLGEQQRLSFARLVLASPRYALLDEATSALDLENQRVLYRLLEGIGATVVSVGHRVALKEHHDFVLELVGDGTWKFYPSDAAADSDRPLRTKH